jgi:RimJ/RimL family protein N-acetyltransferase
MAPTPEQARIVANLKSGPPHGMSIPILSAQASVAGFLTPVTHQMAENEAVVEALFRWRRSHMAAFLTVFIPTLEKTHHYLTSFSLPDAARILFLVADREHRYVGHIGLCNIAAEGAEIDNVVRGEPIDIPGFMVCAHNALLRWAFASLDIPLAYLNVLAHNRRAIRTYRRIGLRAVNRIPLVREEQDGGYRLRPACVPSSGGVEPMLVRMEIPREAFYRDQSRQTP